MNIFVTDECPNASAQVLPDKHIVKMPLECCQMLSIVASDKWGHGYGTIPKQMVNHMQLKKVLSAIIHVLFGQMKLYQMLDG